MSGETKKKQTREGFHRELHKHIELLKHEFDKVETTAIFTYRMENVSAEIRELQNLKDAKIKLLRIRFNFEADLIVKEFKERVQEVLDRDGSASCTDSGNGLEKYGDRGGKKMEEDIVAKERECAEKTEEKGTVRRKGRQRTGKQTRNHDGSSRALETRTTAERSKRVLKSLDDKKSQPNSQSEELTDSTPQRKESAKAKPKAKEGIVGKIHLTRNKTGDLRVSRIERDQHCVQESNLLGQDKNAGSSAVAMEASGNEQRIPSLDRNPRIPDQPVRRSGRERKKTQKAEESTLGTPNPRR